MNLKNNRGYVLTDASIAVLIFMILIPIIMGIVYNVNSVTNTKEVKTGALNIAINTLETAKGIQLEELTTQEIFENLKGIYNVEDINTTENVAVITTEKASYKLKVEVKDYKDDNIVKTVKSTVIFKIKGEEKSIEISTVVK